MAALRHCGGGHLVPSQSTLPSVHRQVVQGSGDHAAPLYMVILFTAQRPFCPRKEQQTLSSWCGPPELELEPHKMTHTEAGDVSHGTL